ncbi:hypothetical protein [Alteribacillus persepolensis]|nr:hypothetical protein [Alteribacillus persepolensis]
MLVIYDLVDRNQRRRLREKQQLTCCPRQANLPSGPTRNAIIPINL